ncbi:hypothetical protein CEXT_679511 [Caerostris extrusa]|uniref:Uncharacterized protein n=1 Tax=Caerostris extrusa TaxID=172846 RepID=A0AAV4Y8K9_CAEEX|nr:hypothetical protein CEXT_679511 [Caerostris extrusa]
MSNERGRSFTHSINRPLDRGSIHPAEGAITWPMISGRLEDIELLSRHRQSSLQWIRSYRISSHTSVGVFRDGRHKMGFL